MASFGIPGFDTGLDVQSLVQQILYLEREPIRALEQRKEDFQRKIDAYNDLNSKLSSLLSSLDTLNSLDSFSAKQTSSSAEDVLTAAAAGTASPGTYQIQVSRLALFDNHVSDAVFSSSNSVIGTGSFDLTVGSTTTNITVDSTNNTLEGLRNSINSSGAEVRAAIINDGSGYRLTITSEESGSAHAISIANNSLTLQDGSTPFNFSRTHSISSEDELDASLSVNGLSIISSSNEVTGVIEGVTLNLKGTSDVVTTVVVSNDVDSVKSAIQEFVEQYNTAYEFINSQFRYLENAGSAGALAGDALVRNIQSALSGVVSRSISGLAGPLNNLAAAGVEMQNDGTLRINDSKLETNLNENFAALRDLFIATASTTHASIEYLGASSSTEPGTYEINITAAAEAAQVVSPNATGTSLGVDETLTITLGSLTAIINLTADMSVDDIIDAMNAQFLSEGMGLTASKDGSDHLIITSNQKGSEVSFTVVSDQTNPAVGTGIGTAGLSDAGLDVAGTFTDTSTSTVYSATGSGDVLVGSEGPVKDLRIHVLSSSTGNFGTVSFTFGYAERLERVIDSYVDSLEGPISGAVESLEANIRRIDDDIDDIEDRLTVRERFLTDQFTRVNQALQQLAYLQSTLSAQLAQLDALIS